MVGPSSSLPCYPAELKRPHYNVGAVTELRGVKTTCPMLCQAGLLVPPPLLWPAFQIVASSQILTQKRKWRSICRIGVRAHLWKSTIRLENYFKFRKLRKLSWNFLYSTFFKGLRKFVTILQSYHNTGDGEQNDVYFLPFTLTHYIDWVNDFS